MFFLREVGSCHIIQSAIRCPCWSGGWRADSPWPLSTTLHHFSAFIDWFAWLNVGKRDKDTLLSCPPPFLYSPLCDPPLCVEPRIISVWSTLSASFRHIKLAQGDGIFRVWDWASACASVHLFQCQSNTQAIIIEVSVRVDYCWSNLWLRALCTVCYYVSVLAQSQTPHLMCFYLSVFS